MISCTTFQVRRYMRHNNPKQYELVAAEKFLTCSDSALRNSTIQTVVRDKDDDVERMRSLQSHVGSGDYFGTLATILDLMLQRKMKADDEHYKLLEGLRNDLLFLHKHYKIDKK